MSTMADARGAASTASPGAILEVEGLTVDFLTDRGWTTVVEDVSFSIGAGETLGIVGESGSGKTVTSMAIMGLIPNPPGRIRSGSVRIQGTDVVGLPQRQMEDIRGDRVAMIFQEPMTSLNPAFTVGDQIAETVRRHRGLSRRAARERAVELLSLVGIPNAARRVRSYPHEFSGGMRQRVMIAMALSCEPALLIADEPTTALDVTIQAQVLDLIKGLKDTFGMSILFITHDLGVVADVCDRVVVMYAGQVVEQAPVVELYGRPQHPYTEGLLRSMPEHAASTGVLHSIPGSPPMVGAFPDGCRFAPRCEYALESCRTSAVELLTRPDGRLTRCARIDEISLEVHRG